MKKSFVLSKFKDPQILYARLKFLSNEMNVYYLRKLCGIDVFKKLKNEEMIQNIKKACSKLRASVLDLTEVERFVSLI